MTRRCPLTYDALGADERYAPRGLRRLSPGLQSLEHLPYSSADLRREALERRTKMSVQGVQLKLSARLQPSRRRFVLVDTGGRYILKPPHPDFAAVPANEDVTMRLAAAVGIEVPPHGLIYGSDDALTYFIKRFDRVGRAGEKMPLEDFAQLCGAARDTKYTSSMENVVRVIDDHCTFPRLERQELFLRTLFSFLVGNEDMHLKNFSLITRADRIQLAPAYDFLNTTLLLPGAREELALPLRGKKARLTRADLVEYFARERLALSDGAVAHVLGRLREALPAWEDLLARCFLPPEARDRYLALIRQRWQVL